MEETFLALEVARRENDMAAGKASIDNIGNNAFDSYVSGSDVNAFQRQILLIAASREYFARANLLCSRILSRVTRTIYKILIRPVLAYVATDKAITNKRY